MPISSNAFARFSILVAVCIVGTIGPSIGQSQDHPNILFLFADDFTYEAISAFGHTDIETPNLDRLVARGTTFTHAYNMDSWSGAVCVASRNMLLTGRSIWRAEAISKSTEEERIKVPKNFLPTYPHHEAIGCGQDLRDEKLAPFPRTENAIRVHRREYYALITHLDQQIGRILESLEKSGKGDNTWIFFTADHGLSVGNHGLLGKQNMYDHSIRVPFIAVGPEAKPNQKISALIYLQDVMATTLELARVKKPESVEFHSLMPLLRAETIRSAYPAIYGAYLQLQRCVVLNDWKLIVYPKANAVRLYDLKSDPLELRDLASDPASTDRKEALFSKLVELQTQMGDALQIHDSMR